MGEQRSHEPLSEEEVMTGRVVWVCEHGHIDVAHKTKGNHLDLCSRCKDGVCEPRKTLGRRSKAQREKDRELGIDSPQPRRGAARPVAPVEVTRPGEAPTVVEPDAFKVETVQSFVLPAEVRRGIVAGGTPRLSFPREAPVDHPEGQPYPAVEGDVVMVAQNLVIVVVGLRVLFDEIVVQYEVRDSRSPASGGDEGRFATSKEAEKPTDRMGGPEFRAEREPERLPRREATKVANRVHEAELRKLRRTREDLGRHLQEQADAPRDIRHHLRMSIDAVDCRIENIEGEMGHQQEAA
jgi:hypothetical protein